MHQDNSTDKCTKGPINIYVYTCATLKQRKTKGRYKRSDQVQGLLALALVKGYCKNKFTDSLYH